MTLATRLRATYLVGALTLSACGHSAPPTHTLTVSASGVCEINGGSWYNASTQDVQVRDPSNKLIGAGTMNVTAGSLPGSGVQGGYCMGSVKIAHVPEVALYQVKIGTVPGVVTFKLADLKKNGWRAKVSVS